MEDTNSRNIVSLEIAIGNMTLSSSTASYASANDSASSDTQDSVNVQQSITDKVSFTSANTTMSLSVTHPEHGLAKLSNISSSSVIVFPTSQDDVEQETLEEKPRSIILGLLSQLKPGTDLSRVTLPTFVLEPRSLLERVTDFMSHQQLILHAHLEENPIRRFIHVIRYYLSAWHIRPKGVKKPYNPVLGEHFKCHWDVPAELFQYDPFTRTSPFEIQNNNSSNFSSSESMHDTTSALSSTDNPIHDDIDPHLPSHHQQFCPACQLCPVTRSYYVAEQVSHHPPISAYFFSNPAHHTTIVGNFRPKSKFLGNSGASIMHGTTHIYFTNRPGEEYIITNPNIYIRGIFLGTMLMELGDIVTIECPKLGLIADIDFKVKGYFTGTYNAISGKIRTLDEEVLYNISGKWTDRMVITPVVKRSSSRKQRASVSSTSLSESKNLSNAQPYEQLTPSCIISSNGSSELLDVSTLHSITLSVIEESKQHPFESRHLWSNVTEAIKNRDMKTATIEKTLIEDRQRAIVKLREIQTVPNPNLFNLTLDDAKPFESRYFTTDDGIRWDFKKNFDGMSLSTIQKFLDEMISVYDYRIPTASITTPTIVIQPDNGQSEYEPSQDQ